MPEPAKPREPKRAGGAAAPTFDEVYDCARKLGTCELVIERTAHRRRRPGLALVLRRTDDGSAVHRAVVRTSIEDAARRIRTSIERQANQREESK